MISRKQITVVNHLSHITHLVPCFTMLFHHCGKLILSSYTLPYYIGRDGN